jgi:hypothetical protein
MQLEIIPNQEGSVKSSDPPFFIPFPPFYFLPVKWRIGGIQDYSLLLPSGVPVAAV